MGLDDAPVAHPVVVVVVLFVLWLKHCRADPWAHYGVDARITMGSTYFLKAKNNNISRPILALRG